MNILSFLLPVIPDMIKVAQASITAPGSGQSRKDAIVAALSTLAVNLVMGNPSARVPTFAQLNSAVQDTHDKMVATGALPKSVAINVK